MICYFTLFCLYDIHDIWKHYQIIGWVKQISWTTAILLCQWIFWLIQWPPTKEKNRPLKVVLCLKCPTRNWWISFKGLIWSICDLLFQNITVNWIKTIDHSSPFNPILLHWTSLSSFIDHKSIELSRQGHFHVTQSKQVGEIQSHYSCVETMIIQLRVNGIIDEFTFRRSNWNH